MSELHEMGCWIEGDEVFISIPDLIKHLRNNRNKMNEVQPEHVTVERFINLLQRFEKHSKEDV